MVGQAVEQRGRELFIAKDLDPLAEGQIGSNDGRPPLVALREQIEEQLTAGALEGHKSQFVHNQKRDLFVALLQAGERAFVAGFEQAVHQVGGAREEDAEAAARSLHTQRDRQHGFSSADRTGNDCGLGASDELAAGQFEDLGFRHAFERCPVDLVQRLDVGETRFAQQPAGGALCRLVTSASSSSRKNSS